MVRIYVKNIDIIDINQYICFSGRKVLEKMVTIFKLSAIFQFFDWVLDSQVFNLDESFDRHAVFHGDIMKICHDQECCLFLYSVLMFSTGPLPCLPVLSQLLSQTAIRKTGDVF